MVSIINKNDTIRKAKEILNCMHGINTPFGWEIAFGMLLDGCKSHLEIHDFGSSAYFIQV